MKNRYFLTLTILILFIILFNISCEDEPTKSQNQAPNIQSVTSNPATSSSNRLPAGGIITFLCTATDPDKDPLSYTWECSGGSFREDKIQIQ